MEENLDFDDLDFGDNRDQGGADKNQAISVIGETFGSVLPRLIQAGEATKSVLSDLAAEVADDVSGNGLTLSAFGRIKYIKEFISKLEDALKDEAVDEALKYGRDGVIDGMKFEIGATAATWDYSGCSAWVELKSQEDQISEKRKRLEKKMQVLSGTVNAVDEEFGEICGARQVKGKNEIVKFPIKSGTKNG